MALLAILVADAGTECFAQAGSLLPQGSSSQDLIEEARGLERTHRHEEAIAVYRKYLERDPGNDEVRAKVARLLSWQEQYDEAIPLYQDILTRHPMDMDVRVAIARVKSWQKKLSEAQSLYEAVLREDPNNLEAKRGLADTLYWNGRYALALPLYEDLYAVAPEPELEEKIQAVKAELAALARVQRFRAPVGLGRPLPTLPFRDYLKVGYSHFTYTNHVPDERDWRVEAAKAIGAQTLVGRIEPMNRFGFQDAQASGELYSPLWQKAWGYIGASAGINPDFLPNWTLGGELFQGLGILHRSLSFIEPSFGYRHMDFKSANVDLLIPGLTIYLPYDTWLTEKIYYVPDTGAITLSSQLTWRASDRVQIFASGGFGTAAERITATQDFTRFFSHIFQGGIIFPLADRLSAETSVYYEDRGALYIRRGGTFNLIFHW
ncbi:MAG: YaiO family outer membrane beta-barrel protein [Nitrospiraceae bacterium]